MSDKINLATFPCNTYEALTMLYLQNQDLSSLSPEELLDKYEETYNKIKQRKKDKTPISPPPIR